MQTPKAYFVIHCSGTTFPFTPVSQEISSLQNSGLPGVTSRDVPDDSNLRRHRCEKLSDFHVISDQNFVPTSDLSQVNYMFLHLNLISV